jgi:uncharacterized protein (DUF1810 family)
MEDIYNLQRFIKEQQRDYTTAYVEVSQGKKRSHWMWYIFPQIVGLGMTATSHKYSIKSIDEAKAYLAHPYLGKNLINISKVLLSLDENDPYKIFGSPDYLKLCSSMTLFAEAAPEEEVFQKVIEKYYGGKKDERTLAILEELGK